MSQSVIPNPLPRVRDLSLVWIHEKRDSSARSVPRNEGLFNSLGSCEARAYFALFLRSNFSVRTNSLRVSKFDIDRVEEVTPSRSA